MNTFDANALAHTAVGEAGSSSRDRFRRYPRFINMMNRYPIILIASLLLTAAIITTVLLPGWYYSDYGWVDALAYV